jgi:nucleotide-binding universal stress UspA family protein
MDKYKRLLVAVDGSDTSLHALQESFKLTGSWVTVVTVAPFYEGDLRLVGVANPQALMTEPCNTALETAQEMADRAGAVIQTVCAVGRPHEGIVDLAAAGSRDLIVMGAKGQTQVLQ